MQPHVGACLPRQRAAGTCTHGDSDPPRGAARPGHVPALSFSTAPPAPALALLPPDGWHACPDGPGRTTHSRFLIHPTEQPEIVHAVIGRTTSADLPCRSSNFLAGYKKPVPPPTQRSPTRSRCPQVDSCDDAPDPLVPQARPELSLSLSRSTSRTTQTRATNPRATSPAKPQDRLIPSHGRREACGRAIPARRLPRPRPARAAGLRAAPSLLSRRPPPPRCRGRPARGVRRQGRRRGGGSGGRDDGRGAEGGVGAQGEEGVGAAHVPGGRGDVQPRDHLHGRRSRLLPLRLANGGRRRDSGDGNVRHLRTLRGRRGRDGVLGALGAPRAVARLAVAHARVAPPATRRAVRAQRRLRHRQRRPGHGPPRLRLLQPRTRPGPLLRRGARDHAVRDGVHVRARRPGPPPLPRRAHRERALLPAGRRRPPDSSHGQVRQRAIWAVPRPQGAGGGGRDGGAGEGDPEEDQEKRDAGRDAMRYSYSIKDAPATCPTLLLKIAEYILVFFFCM